MNDPMSFQAHKTSVISDCSCCRWFVFKILLIILLVVYYPDINQ